MAIEVTQISPHQAAQAMTAAGLRAPLECDSAEGIAEHGQCFEFSSGGKTCAFVVRQKGEILLIDAAATNSSAGGMTAAGLALADTVANRMECTHIAFETNRRGLVRLAQKNGYQIAGYILKKAVKK